MLENKSMQGKVAMVTGASSGIGRATALAFGKEGATVVVGDVLEKDGKETVKVLEHVGAKALFVKCDVSKKSDVEDLINKTVKTFGSIDYAYNNAGVEGLPASTTDCTDENWEKTININLKGVWLCMRYQIPQMLKQGSGAIVNCASIAGLVGFQSLPAYVASKHGVIGLTKTAALEYAKSNIRVNAVCPGVIQTPMIDRFIHGDQKFRQQLQENEPIGRIGKPEEIANAVLFLCSDAASFITGHPMVIDGGWVAQ